MANNVNSIQTPASRHTPDLWNFLPHSASNQTISTVNVSRSDVSMELADAKSAADAFEAILLDKRALESENGNMHPNILSEPEREQLIEYANKYEHQLASAAGVADFLSAYDTYLYLIAFVEGRFRVVIDYTVVNRDKKKKKAFIVLNGDMTVCGPLFLSRPTVEQQFIFALDDTYVHHYVEQYIDKLNRTDPRAFPVIYSTSDSNVQHEPSTMNAESLADEINICVSREQILPNAAPTIDASIQSVEELFAVTWDVDTEQLNAPSVTTAVTAEQDNSPASDTIEETISTVSHQDASVANSRDPHSLVESAPSEQLNDLDRVMEADLTPANPAPGTSTSLSNTTTVSRNSPAPMSTALSYAKPEVLRQPKADWNARYPRDLIPQPKKNATNQKTKFIGLLQGMGGQRTQIEVKIPTREKRQMYLASAVRTLTNERHPLKLIVPGQTQVNKDRVNHENYLNYLEFHQCNPAHFFDLETWTIYMKITPTEHGKRRKKVPIYMFNLYQNQRMTKDLIRREQLDKCRLVFWLCVRQNNCYVQISDVSSSQIITERKKKKP